MTSNVEYVQEPFVTWYKLKWTAIYYLIIVGSLWTGFQVQAIVQELSAEGGHQERNK